MKTTLLTLLFVTCTLNSRNEALFALATKLQGSRSSVVRFTVYEDADGKGASKNVLAVTNSRGPVCHNLPYDWEDRVSSINTNEGCIQAFPRSNCRGQPQIFRPGSPNHGDFEQLNFNDVMASYQQCFH